MHRSLLDVLQQYIVCCLCLLNNRLCVVVEVLTISIKHGYSKRPFAFIIVHNYRAVGTKIVYLFILRFSRRHLDFIMHDVSSTTQITSFCIFKSSSKFGSLVTEQSSTKGTNAAKICSVIVVSVLQ